MSAYYNEVDPKAAAWLRELIKGGHIAAGEVDERDIRDVTAADLRGFKQHHFFAGIGVWSFALRLAGWPDDKPVWTGSCPCQPFSSAGKRKGTSDERHLWPAWHWLIKQHRPSTVFGEQVASPDGIAWLDLVSSDLEGEGYACGPVVLPACGVGAPHIRSRIWFVADSDRVAWRLPEEGGEHVLETRRGRKAGVMEHASRKGRGRTHLEVQESFPSISVSPGGVGNAGCDRAWEHPGELPRDEGQHEVREADGDHASESPGPVNGSWAGAEWVYCRDGKFRPLEPGSFPLAHGAPERVGRLRGYGNAIVAQAAAEVISAYRWSRGC